MRSRARVTVLLMAVTVMVIVGLIGATRGRSLNAQNSSDKPSRICDPTDCRIAANRRPADCACRYSVVLIDLSGKGLELTNVENGVDFDLNSEGSMKQKVSWTTANSAGSFLFLDSNQDRMVNNGGELFGSLTPQVPSPADPERNGFLALAYYERPGFGGNSDGVIDGRDAIFTKLRLWWDSNHNGISEPSELHTLKEVGIEAISLAYKKAERTDQYGNLIRYESDVYGANHKKVGTAYDLILLPAQ
jgi:hypothetical protein